jgi:hypothetical protein
VNVLFKPVLLAVKLGAANDKEGDRMPKIIGNNALVFLIFSRSFVLCLGLKPEGLRSL